MNRVDSLTNHKISAGYVDGDSSKENVNRGMYSVLFMSPELLVSRYHGLFASSIHQKRLVGLVVDAAHCVVKW